MDSKIREQILKAKIAISEGKGYSTSGCIRKWKRELRNLNKKSN